MMDTNLLVFRALDPFQIHQSYSTAMVALSKRIDDGGILILIQVGRANAKVH